MRYFIISDEGGNPIYYDHKDGRLLSLVLVNTHIMMKENLGQRFKSMTCGHTLFVFQKYEKLSYLVVSDQGESEMFLRSLLRQIFEHMVMVFGRQAIEEGKYSTFSRHKLTIQHIIDTLCALSDRQQSLLVRATERLEVDDRTRGECFKALKNALKQEPLATHGLLFVGTKLLATYSKNKAPDIDPSDMLLLINDFRATFHPYEREVEETVIPAADYSQVSSTLSTQESGERDRDEGFVSASEELTWDEDGKFTQDNIRLLSMEICEGLYDKVCLKAQELEKEKNVRQMQKEREKINQSSESFKRLFVGADDNGPLGNNGRSSLHPAAGHTNATHTTANTTEEDDVSTRRRKKNIRRKSSRATSKDASGERWDERIEQWREEQREKELDKRKQESEREETVESGKDILIADFMENLDKGEFKIGLNGDCVLLLQEMLHLISFFPGALDGNYGEKSALSVSAFQETSRIPVNGAVDLVTAKLLLEQVLTHFKKPKATKKRVAFVDDDGVAPSSSVDADTDADGLLHSDVDTEGGGGGAKAKESSDEGADSDAGKQGERSSSGSSDDDGSAGRSRANKADEMEPQSSTADAEGRRPLRIDGEDDDDDTFLIEGSSSQGEPFVRTNRPLIPSSPVDGTAMLAKEPKLKLGREDSSSSDEAGFVSPLASPHNVAPHRSLKEEIEREKERERDRLDDARQRREEAAEEEAERRAQGGPSQAGDSETSGADAQHKRERATVGESSEDLGLSLDDVDFDHPFPELDYNLRQPFDPENSTSYKLLHLRTPKYTPRWVYYAELERMTTLVIITSNHPSSGAKGQPAERDRLDEIRDQLRGMIRNYATYLITKEHTHLPVLSFLHQFPGLIHFIFVDRTFNRVIAPPITAVHGPVYSPKPEEALRMKLILRSKVWDMCYRAQQHLSEGHHAMTMKSGAFQYSYRLWVEDMEGFELPFNHDQPFIAQRGPQTHKYYKKLVEHIFPSRSGLRCYELYTLYLGVLSVKSITHYDRNLVAILLDRKNK